MTDREKMILVIKQYYEELKRGFRGNPVEVADRLIAAGFGMVNKGQPERRAYWLKYDDGKYLVKGSFNGKPFDGNGQPYRFNEKDAKEISETLNFEMEQASGSFNE